MTEELIPQTKLDEHQLIVMNKLAANLYIKGLNGPMACGILKLEAEKFDKHISDGRAYQMFYNAKKVYLSGIQMMNQDDLQKSAVLEMEHLENEIREKVTMNNPKKMEVLLNVKRHRHDLEGLSDIRPNIEINITSDQDKTFVQIQNEVKEIKE